MSTETKAAPQQFDCIIIGGGMVGGTIACGLDQAGFKVAVVEPSPAPEFDQTKEPDLRVSAISFASEQVLRNIGAWPYLEAMRMCPYRRLAVHEIHEKEGFAAMLPDISAWARTEFDASKIGQSHLGHIVENVLVQKALHLSLQKETSATLFCPDQAESMDLSGQTKVVRLQSGELLEAPLVIGADGANSQVRASAKIGQYKEQYEQHAFVCSISYQGEQQDITWQAFRRAGPLAFLPLMAVEGKQFGSLVWYDSPEKHKELMALDDEALIKEIQANFPKDLMPINQIHGRGRFPLFKSHAHQYAIDGVVLAGDSAHTINPLAGQGVNLGFMDAASLIEVLANARMNEEDWASVNVLNRYVKNRRLANQIMMNAMDVFYHGFSNKHLPVRVLRNVGLGIAERAGFAKKQVIKYAMGLSGDLPRLSKPI